MLVVKSRVDIGAFGVMSANTTKDTCETSTSTSIGRTAVL
jgi:hypothetical protein